MTASGPGRNLLASETSPYLLQHRDNPVHWMPWGEAAFRRARAEDKPILLSVGYAACHWCHVMAHESFEDEGIAALMNALFVSVKVDREERPDLDLVYQQALALMGQQGGWPLTMFLTPDGEPFWGGTYFPPAARWGRPGLPEVLRGVAAAYAHERDRVAGNVAALREGLARLSVNRAAGPIAPSVLDQVAGRLVREVDPVHGGIGTAPKFPQPGIIELLWRAWLRSGRESCRSAVRTTLDAMCRGGIYDHLGGGFARYSTDECWLVPHFEKMLYDNAQLVDLLTLVWRGTGEPLYAARVHETVDWVLREMVAEKADGTPCGAFASTLDADSEGVEGRFYVWTEAEIDALLGADAGFFKEAYDVRPGGNWEGVTILNRIGRPEPTADEEARLASLRAVLRHARGRRVRPGRDDKVLADWNGLMIAALAGAGFSFREQGWIAAAARAFDFVARHMTGPDGRLVHSWRCGTARHPASLDDHAGMARAALALYEATGEPRYLDHARIWAGVLDRHYWDGNGGGYFFTADDGERLPVRAKSAADGAVPSGNGTMAGVLARLYLLTGEDAWRARAEAVITAFSGELAHNFFPLATLLNAVGLLSDGCQVVVVGERGDPATEALVDAVRTGPSPDRVTNIVAPGTELPETHPAHGKGLVRGRPAGYVCRAQACSPPVTEPDALRDLLEGR
jgi:uncharacterized protein YyaL (SSP411 family)